MVTAIVRGDVGEVSLRHIPVDSGMVVTTLRKEAQVFLISRDDLAEWFQALYQSPLGIKYGWLRADQIEGISFRGNAINILDLPITNFELNTRDDVKQLIQEMKPKTKPSGNTADGFGCISFLGGIFLAAYVLNTSRDTGFPFGISFDMMLVIVFFLVFILPLFSLDISRKIDAPAREQLDLWKKQKKRYNQLQSNMRSDYEMMRDDQRRDTAIGFAANLGATLLNTAASRYITDRQKVTIEHQTKRK